eukprot:6175760-Pleurochrysis_carterae.AAC.1
MAALKAVLNSVVMYSRVSEVLSGSSGVLRCVARMTHACTTRSTRWRRFCRSSVQGASCRVQALPVATATKSAAVALSADAWAVL